MNKIKFAALFISLSLLFSTAYAELPNGAVKLTRKKRFTVGKVKCGYVQKQWQAGTLLTRTGYFITHARYSTWFKGQANKASGAQKKQFLKKAAKYNKRKSDENPACKNGPSSTLNIIGARALVVLPSSAVSSLTANVRSTANKLYKISDAGNLEEVLITNELVSNAQIGENPVGVYDVDSSYFIVVYGTNELNGVNGHLINKQDGRVYSLSDSGFPSLGGTNTNYKNGKFVSTDQFGNIFFIKRGSYDNHGVFDIVKLDVSNPEAILSSVISPADESIFNFEVDPNGHCIYYGTLKADNNTRVNRILKNNRGIQNIPSNTIFWIGPDNNFYYYSDVLGIKKVVIDNLGNVSTFDYADNSISIPGKGEAYKFSFGDRLIFAASGTSVTARIVEVFNASNTPRTIATLPILTISAGAQSSNYYYLAGQRVDATPVLIKVDPLSDTSSELYLAGKYDVYSMVVSDNDEVIFSALRLSDGKKVLVKIDSSGVESVIKESLGANPIVLTQIN